MADPVLFRYNDKDYKVDDIERWINQNLERELNGILGGDKYRLNILNTLYGTSDEDPGLIAGLRNGTLVDNNGRLRDYTNRYTNNPKVDQDYTGWSASILGHALQNVDAYISPEEQARIDAEEAMPDYDSGAGLTSDLSMLLFGSNSPNDVGYKDFRNMGSKRIAYLSDAIKKLNLDRYKNLSDEDKARQLQNIQDVITALEDNDLTDDEYIRLSKLTNGIDWHRMFGATDAEDTAAAAAAEAKAKADQEATDAKAKDEALLREWTEWLARNYSWFTQLDIPLSDINDSNNIFASHRRSTYSELDLKDIINYYLNYRTSQEYLNNAVPNNGSTNGIGVKDYTDALTRYHLKNAIDSGAFNAYQLGDYHYLYTDDLNRAIAYNSNTGTLSAIWAPSIIGDLLYQQFLNLSQHSSASEALRIYDRNNPPAGSVQPEPGEGNPESGKHGMSIKKKTVLKAQGGIEFPTGGFDDIYDAIRWFDDNGKLIYNHRWRNIVDLSTGNITHEERANTHATDNTNPGNKQYDPEYGGLQVESQDFWNKWVDLLTKNEDLAKTFAEEYRYYAANNGNTDLKMPQSDKWFNSDGTFNFQEFKKTANADGKALWNDSLNGIGHDFYTGLSYYIEDKNGTKKHYKDIPEGWHVTETTNASNPLVIAVKLEQDKGEEGGEERKKPEGPFSELSMTEWPKKLKLLDEKPLPDIAGLASEISKYGITRHGLRLELNDLLSHHKLYQLNPDFRQTAVTNGWQLRVSGEQALGSAMTQADRNLTSDAGMQAARLFQGFEIGLRYKTQAEAAAKKEFNTKQAEAKADTDYSHKSAIDTANKNAQLRHDFNTEEGNMWADYHNKVTTARQNLVESLNNFRKQYRTDKKDYEKTTNERNQAMLAAAYQRKASNALDNFVAELKKTYPDDDYLTRVSRDEYIDFNKELNKWLSNRISILPFTDMRNPDAADLSIFNDDTDLNDIISKYNTVLSGILAKNKKSTASKRYGGLLKKRFK